MIVRSICNIDKCLIIFKSIILIQEVSLEALFNGFAFEMKK